MPRIADRPSLKVLREGERDLPALYFIHPSGGRSTVYQALADTLTWAGPIVGIDAAMPPPERPRETALRDLASDYCELLRAAEVPRPYYLFGWIIGGLIAAEMALQLQEQGEPVAFLGLMETIVPPPEFRSRPTDSDSLARAYVDTMGFVVGKEARPIADTSPAGLTAALAERGILPQGWGATEVAAQLATFMSIVRGFLAHGQRRLTLPLHLYEVAELNPMHPRRPASLGWEDHADRIERTTVAGDHFSMIDAAHAPALAAQIDTSLSRLAR